MRFRFSGSAISHPTGRVEDHRSGFFGRFCLPTVVPSDDCIEGEGGSTVAQVIVLSGAEVAFYPVYRRELGRLELRCRYVRHFVHILATSNGLDASTSAPADSSSSADPNP